MKNNKYHKPPITCKIKHNHYKHLPSRVAMSGMSLHCAYGVGKGNETHKCLLCDQNIFTTANLYIKEH
jgi:hypothetical protein